ncbi:DUF982 domain-containing protein (plasmid) [Ensifer adhaerens]|uniref:DUF982 domain-containing protein n=1 Tax=Ensifer adhaerens TaxID=106592 RepID=UPI0023A9F703|nr:DUF982 domain-containing protein [Ensifer adhaerens]WDZ81864.1 DUF982 domain-containing protein [Ensifer adhaerens]
MLLRTNASSFSCPRSTGADRLDTGVQAAHLLSDCWPVDHGIAYAEALDECTDANAGRLSFGSCDDALKFCVP